MNVISRADNFGQSTLTVCLTPNGNMPYFPYNRVVTFPYKRSGTVMAEDGNGFNCENGSSCFLVWSRTVQRCVELWESIGERPCWMVTRSTLLNCSPIQFLFYFISHALELYRTQVHYAFITMDMLNE